MQILFFVLNAFLCLRTYAPVYLFHITCLTRLPQ